jgi:hypothetical protein
MTAIFITFCSRIIFMLKIKILRKRSINVIARPEGPKQPLGCQFLFKGVIAACVFLVLALCGAGDAHAGWYSSGGTWGYRKQVTISKSMVANTSQTDFPVLISRGTDGDLAARALSTGNDILFTSSDGTTKLKHEIESYTTATGALVAWVKIPSLSASADTVIYMYYGNGSSGDQSDKANVWDTNFKGVWHLPNGTSLTANDSTSNGKNGSLTGNTTAVAGNIDGGAVFDGIGDSIDTSLVSTAINDITMEFWANIRVASNARGTVFFNHAYGIVAGSSDGGDTTKFFILGQAKYWLNTGIGWTQNTWHHIVGTLSSGNVWKLYKDGELVYTSSAQVDASVPSDITTLGAESSGGPSINHYLDEVRFSSGVRTADWIKTEYNNQSAPATYQTFGPEDNTDPAACTSGGSASGWYGTGGVWTYRKKITISCALAANSSQTDFPVLVSIPIDADLAAHALSTGNDILFTSSDGTSKLKHEIEKYTTSTGELVAWVKISSLSYTANTVLYMYYGNGSASDQSDKANVWDSNYVMVQHMKESSGGAGAIVDSTSNDNDGTNSGSLSLGASGRIGLAFDFAGGVVTVAHQSSQLVTGGFTMSAWVFPDTAGGGSVGRILDKSTSFTGAGGFLYSVGGGNGTFQMNLNNGGIVAANNSVISYGAWQYVVITAASDNTLTHYIDGLQNGTPAASGALSGITTTNSLTIGNRLTNDRGFDGKMDEVRLSKVARSADWIKTEYKNQAFPTTYRTVGAEEGATACTAAGSASGWYNTGGTWSYRKKITLACTMTPNSSQTDFPVLVSLPTDSNLAAHAQSDGDDILFTSDNGTTKLSHEIEKYTSSTGELKAWVKISSLSYTANTAIYLYYGNGSISSRQDPTNVWDASYVSVWHLPNGSSLSAADSKNAHNGTILGSATAATGKIDGGLSNPAQGDTISFGDVQISTGGITIEGWVNPSSFSATNNKEILSHWENYALRAAFNTNGKIKFSYKDAGGTWHEYQTDNIVLTLSTWTHVALSYTYGTGSSAHMYINGAEVGAGWTGTGNGSPAWTPNYTGYIGNYNTYTDNFWPGTIDEIRLSTAARSADWIATEYNNMVAPATYTTVGSEEANTASCSAAGSASGWYNTGGIWSYRKKITFACSMTANSNQTDFPVLVSIPSDTDLAAKALSTGSDILFTSDDGTTKLKHEIERYTSASGELLAWVKIPTFSYTANTAVYMYYGNASASDQSDKTNVWSSSFLGVWHLPNGTTLSTSDSLNTFNGTIDGATVASGQVDGAASFDGNNDRIYTSDFTTSSNYTFSAWVNANASQATCSSDSCMIVSQRNNGNWYEVNGQLKIQKTTGKIFGEHVTSGYAVITTYGTSNLLGAGWKHLAVTYDGTSQYVYVNGVAENHTDGAGPWTTGSQPLSIGQAASTCCDTQWFTGSVDEVHRSSTARSADWLLTEYNNEGFPVTFRTLAAEETMSSGPGGAFFQLFDN